ncbi:hypothetical protein [Spirosoma areae]
MRLVKQFAKVMKIKTATVKETPAQKREREFLEGIDRSAEQVKAHLRGEMKLKSMDEFLNEL